MTEHTWAAVRCCCTPKKIFGFLLIPEGAKRVALRRKVKPVPMSPEINRFPVWETVGMADIRAIELFHEPSGELFRELAVYSDDRPIEFWRDIAGFREVKE